jgi:hypothetical protein
MISKLYLTTVVDRWLITNWLLTNGQQQLLDKACWLLTNGQ